MRRIAVRKVVWMVDGVGDVECDGVGDMMLYVMVMVKIVIRWND